jgi:hypothetical protein
MTERSIPDKLGIKFLCVCVKSTDFMLSLHKIQFVFK